VTSVHSELSRLRRTTSNSAEAKEITLQSRPSSLIDADSIDLLHRAAAAAVDTHPHPNPRVGCVVQSESGDVVGEGVHVTAGAEHAEVAALRASGDAARNGTLYVTLEPCVHHGRTPPCVDAIVEAGIRRVVVGALDPDERISGAGVAQLYAQGIAVEIADTDSNTEWVDPGYFHHRRTRLPYVTLKLASTLDGQAAAADGTSQWITTEDARRDVHRLRARTDAVMVGAGTVRTDNPRLDVRIDGYDGHQPVPVVIAGRNDIPQDSVVFARGPLVYTSRQDLTGHGKPIVVAGDGEGVNLCAVMADLGRRSFIDVLVEGGPGLAGSLLRRNLVDRLVWYFGPKLGGGLGRPTIEGVFATLDEALELDIVDVTSLGTDVRVTALVGIDR